MTKEKYLEVRDMTEIPKEIWYKYYKERGGMVDEDKFWEAFVKSLVSKMVVVNRDGPKQIDFKTALDSFYGYYNRKFNV